MEHLYDVVIIGGGPVGLYAALQAQALKCDFILLESQEQLGGQLMELYPEKEIIDLSGHDSILAKDYVGWLLGQFSDESRAKLFCHQKVTGIDTQDETVKVETARETYIARYVIVATGLGVYMPRLLECHGADGCRNIIYALHRLDFLKDKRVAILGGGDAALDWARDISCHTPYVTLIHRRRDFRGDINTIAKIKTLTIKTPYNPIKVDSRDGDAYRIHLQHVETLAEEPLEVDYVFVNYGHIPVSASFGLEKLGPGLKVTSDMETSGNRIFAVGDVASYEGKKRRIDSGIQEVNRAFGKMRLLSDCHSRR